jgi:hypothetical protein
MPEISRFLGIVIYMNWLDHPLPHFHAKYGDYEITVEIMSGVVRGAFPKRALRAVLEWSELNTVLLMQNWQAAQNRSQLTLIPPLE